MSDTAPERRVLFVATLDSHIHHFHLPFMHLLQDMGYTVEAAAAPSGFAGRIEAEGFHVYTIPFSHTPLNPCNIRAYRQLFRLMRTRNYAMVHLNTPVAAFLGRIAAHHAGIPHILYMAHGFHFHRNGRLPANVCYFLLEAVGAHYTTTLVTINRDDYAAAQKHFASAGTHVVYVPGVGVDTAVFSVPAQEERMRARQELGIAGEATVLAWTGELNANKRPQDAVRLLRLSRAEGADIILLLAGTGPLERSLRTDSALPDDSVRLLGYVQDMRRILQAADIFLNTSRREGLPLSVMEAMATGLPIVAYNIRGCSDLVVDGETGFLVTPGDVHMAADRIVRLAADAGTRCKMGEAGRIRIEQKFSLMQVVPQMKKVYEDELGREKQ